MGFIEVAIVISNNYTRLFISYAPGAASTSLEQYLRTVQGEFEQRGLYVFHYPRSEFGIGDAVDRHVSYVDFLTRGGGYCTYVATGTRNPFAYYLGEYKRMISKWAPLLCDRNSWIYGERSRSTLKLTLAALDSDGFDEWFYDVLKIVESHGYMMINEDHLAGATHFIRTEEAFVSLIDVLIKTVGVNIVDFGVPYPEVNVTGYNETYRDLLSEATKNWQLNYFLIITKNLAIVFDVGGFIKTLVLNYSRVAAVMFERVYVSMRCYRNYFFLFVNWLRSDFRDCLNKSYKLALMDCNSLYRWGAIFRIGACSDSP